MINVASIVEGDGEVQALPVLLRRLNEWRTPEVFCNVLRPIRVRKDQFLNREEVFRKQLQIAAAVAEENGWVLILLDADDDCPFEAGKKILERAKAIIPYRRISVVLANKEFEAWFIAAASSLDGHRGFELGSIEIPDAESVRGGKEWISQRIPNGKYHEVTDQPAFAALIDLDRTHENSRSFRKLCKEWLIQAESISTEQNEV